MEAAQTTAVNQNLPQQNSQQHSTDPPLNNSSSSRKRPLGSNVLFEDSAYYKMRAIVRDLRPHFIEVLKTPNFRNCKAAEEIRQKMKSVMDLYKEMIAELPLPEESKNVTGNYTSSETQEGRKHPSYTKPTENKPFFSGSSISQKQEPEGGQPEGYVVGGSAFGWNFITLPESKVTYYGRTKESFRSANVKSEVE